MTVLEAYEAVLIELNKVKAPSLSMNDFIYFLNKATQQYTNEMYNSYEVNQQRVDDMRTLRNSVRLELKPSESQTIDKFYQNVYETLLPEDYFHILNCVVQFNVHKASRCGDSDVTAYYGAKRLTSDANPWVIDNYYLQPSYKNPYFYINEIQLSSDNPGAVNNQSSGQVIVRQGQVVKLSVNSEKRVAASLKIGEDVLFSLQGVKKSEMIKVYRALLKLKNVNTKYSSIKAELISSDVIELSIPGITGDQYSGSSNLTIEVTDKVTDFQTQKESYVRYGNNTRSRIEIRYGQGSANVTPVCVFVDYLRVPQRISLTVDQLDDKEDNSQVFEFPDYVVYEIINRTTKLVLENVGDPRTQLNTAVNQTIPTAPVANQ